MRLVCLPEKVLFIEFDCGKVNEVDKAELEHFERLIQKAEKYQKKAHVLVLSGTKLSSSGKKIFCAGADTKERTNWILEKKVAHVDHERSVLAQLRKLPFYVITLVDGYALGLGSELCCASDYVIATADALFAFPESRLGIVPGAGGTAWCFTESKDPHLSFYHIASGKKFNRDIAVKMGLVDECVDKVLDGWHRISEINKDIAQGHFESLLALKQAKHNFYQRSESFRIESNAYKTALSAKE